MRKSYRCTHQDSFKQFAKNGLLLKDWLRDPFIDLLLVGVLIEDLGEAELVAIFDVVYDALSNVFRDYHLQLAPVGFNFVHRLPPLPRPLGLFTKLASLRSYPCECLYLCFNHFL